MAIHYKLGGCTLDHFLTETPLIGNRSSTKKVKGSKKVEVGENVKNMMMIVHIPPTTCLGTSTPDVALVVFADEANL